MKKKTGRCAAHLEGFLEESTSANLHSNKPHDFDLPLTNKTEVEWFDLNPQSQNQTAFQQKDTPTVRHGGGGVMIWHHFERHRTWKPCNH